MAELPGAFDARKHDGMDDYTPPPAGEYVVQIVKSESHKNKNTPGRNWRIFMKILQGDQKGRQVMTLLNLDNPNPVAVEIANKELKSICDAVGVVQCTDTQQLHGIPFKITTIVEETPGYNPKAVVRKYERIGASPVSAVKKTEPDDAPDGDSEPATVEEKPKKIKKNPWDD